MVAFELSWQHYSTRTLEQLGYGSSSSYLIMSWTSLYISNSDRYSILFSILTGLLQFI